MSGPYDPARDLAELLAGLQAPRSMLGGRALGAALEPFDRLRKGLDLFGWPDADTHERLLRRALALREVRFAPYQEFSVPSQEESYEAPPGPVVIRAVGYRDDDVVIYWAAPAGQQDGGT
jgi:hypothetical protein